MQLLLKIIYFVLGFLKNDFFFCYLLCFPLNIIFSYIEKKTTVIKTIHTLRDKYINLHFTEAKIKNYMKKKKKILINLIKMDLN